MPPESPAEMSEGLSRSEMGASATSTGSAPALSIGDDWAAHLTQKVEVAVSMVRDKTVRPVAKAVRYLIFGLVAGSVGVLIAVMSAVFALRVLDTEVPIFRTRVWASYLIVGGIFLAMGLLLSRKRHPRK
ncbi:MAG: hypothetical protein ACYCSF_10910 [Acidimicrobiales bacterium]